MNHHLGLAGAFFLTGLCVIGFIATDQGVFLWWAGVIGCGAAFFVAVANGKVKPW